MCFQLALRIPGFSCEQLQQGYPGSAWVGSKGFLQSDRRNIAMVGKREKRKQLPFNSKCFKKKKKKGNKKHFRKGLC